MEDLWEEDGTILERMWKRGMIRRGRKIARRTEEWNGGNARATQRVARCDGQMRLTNDAPLLLNAAHAYETVFASTMYQLLPGASFSVIRARFV